MIIPKMVSTRNFANPIHAKIGAVTILQEATPNVGKLSLKWVPLNWDFIVIKRICGLIHMLSRSIYLLSKIVVWVLTGFRRFWYKHFRFDPNYRTVVVASIEMLLAQRILDMAYFLHYYYYDHLLSIIIIYNPKESCCYARPASVIISSNTGLKCWPCQGRTLRKSICATDFMP